MTDIKNKREIERLLELSTEELLFELGQSVKPVQYGIRIPSPNDFRLAATNWIDEQKQFLQRAICLDERVSDFISNPSTERRIEIIAVIGDIISTNLTCIPAFNYIVYQYFKFFSFCFVLLHEIGHIYMGHLNYSENNMGIQKLYGNGSNESHGHCIAQAFEVSADIFASVIIFYQTRLVVLYNRSKNIIGNDFDVNVPEGIAAYLSILMNVYIPSVVPYYLSSIYPVDSMMLCHPPAILRSFLCQNGIILDSGFRDMVREDELRVIVSLWIRYEKQLLLSDYCGEKEFIITDEWKNRKNILVSYLELLAQLNMPGGFNNDYRKLGL